MNTCTDCNELIVHCTCGVFQRARRFPDNSYKAYQATPHGTLLEQIMDCRVAKNEREHAAAREIERLRAHVADLQSNGERLKEVADAGLQEIKELRAQVDALRAALRGM